MSTNRVNIVEKMRSHMEYLACLYLTTPGLIGGPLTPKEKRRLTVIERVLYEDLRETLEPDCPQAKRQFWLERILPPQLKRVENKSMQGTVRDWKELFYEHSETVDLVSKEAEESSSEALPWLK